MREAAPAGAVHAPLEVLVEQPARVRRTGEVVGGRRAKALDLDRKGREHLLLGGEAGDHALLGAPLRRVERERRDLEPGPLQERRGHEPAGAGVIRGHLDDRGHWRSPPGKQRAGGMDRERAGVVVGVTALIGMRDHDLGAQRRAARRQGLRQPGEPERGALVGSIQDLRPVGRDAGERERCRQLGIPRLRVVLPAGEARRPGRRADRGARRRSRVAAAAPVCASAACWRRSPRHRDEPPRSGPRAAARRRAAASQRSRRRARQGPAMAPVRRPGWSRPAGRGAAPSPA